MLLAYVDESYTDDLFCLGCVVVGEEAIQTIEEGFDGILDDYRSAAPGLMSGAEFHGYPLFHGNEVWAGLKPRQRINVYDRAMTVIGNSGAALILRGMDLERQRKRYPTLHPPHEVVFGHLLERINEYATAQDRRVVVLADEVHTSERHRTNFRAFRQIGTPGYRRSTLPRIVDTIHFAPSHHSRLLQAADLVAFLHRRRSSQKEPNARAQATTDKIWSRVQPAIVHQRTWVP